MELNFETITCTMHGVELKQSCLTCNTFACHQREIPEFIDQKDKLNSLPSKTPHLQFIMQELSGNSDDIEFQAEVALNSKGFLVRQVPCVKDVLFAQCKSFELNSRVDICRYHVLGNSGNMQAEVNDRSISIDEWMQDLKDDQQVGSRIAFNLLNRKNIKYFVVSKISH